MIKVTSKNKYKGNLVYLKDAWMPKSKKLKLTEKNLKWEHLVAEYMTASFEKNGCSRWVAKRNLSKD